MEGKSGSRKISQEAVIVIQTKMMVKVEMESSERISKIF